MCRRKPSVRRTSDCGCYGSAAYDPAPLTGGQLRELLIGAGRQLSWGLPAVAREVHRWHGKASEIPDIPIRADALHALTRKRGQTDGAALFSILPRAANSHLLRALVSYQILWDFLDNVGERAPTQENGRQLNRALVDALDPARPVVDYYKHHLCSDDGGYLYALVASCRQACSRLPGYALVRDLAVREAKRAEVLAMNHEPDLRRRVAMLQSWARSEFPACGAATWFELSGAASAGLTIFALLALASEERCGEADVALTAEAYFPWPGALATMLDSYVDRREDLEQGAHVYVDYYGGEAIVVRRTGELIQRSLSSVAALPSAHKHFVIIASMVAMYLSKDSARSPELRRSTALIADAGGSLTAALLPVLRLWRVAYRLRSM